MYKSKLQEFCQSRSWRLPVYSHTKEGFDHNPLFSASVIVNDTSFRSSVGQSSSKLAHNEAAKIALMYFTEPQSSSAPVASSPGGSSTTSPLSGCSVVGENLNDSATINGPTDVTGPLVDFDPSFSDSMGFSGCSLVGENVYDLTTVNGPIDVADPQVDFDPSFIDSMRFSGLSIVSDDLDSERLVEGSQLQETSQCFIDESATSNDLQLVYKSQLQIFAQKRNLTLPTYSSAREGPPHNPLFKSTVTINGENFEGSGVFRTLKEAEHAAAKVALKSVLRNGVQEDDSGWYKNLLQALVREEGFGLPIYTTNMSGECHMPTFVSTVKINEEIFEGNKAKAKKQAEASAAKVAYIALTERKKSSRPQVVSSERGTPETSSNLFRPVGSGGNSRDRTVTEPLKQERVSGNADAGSCGWSPSNIAAMATGHAVKNKVIVFPRSSNMASNANNMAVIYGDDNWVAISSLPPRVDGPS